MLSEAKPPPAGLKVKRLALAIRKIGDNEQAVQLIDASMARMPARLKARARDQCHAYITQAEMDQKKALEGSTPAIERDFVQRGMEFLE